METNCGDQKIFFGAGDGDLPERLANLVGARVLFVTGKDSFRLSGAEKFLREALNMEIEFRFSDFNPNPTYDDVLRGIKVFAEVGPDAIIAVGGGSVLDMAKLINLFGSTQWSLSQYLQQAHDTLEPVLLPLVAIPTTAGSGSEATGFAVLYKDGEKHSVAHSCMLPDVAILNPELTLSMSPYQTACCGFDALAQSVESYWAVGATDVSRQYSAKATALCMRHLEKAVLTPAIEHRSGMMEAAYWAGKAINIAKTTAAHALSYTLTAHYGLPHGHAVAMMLPWVFALNAEISTSSLNDSRGVGFAKNTMDDLGCMLGGGSAEETVLFLQELCCRIGLDRGWIKAAGVNVEEMHAHIVDDVNENRLGNNPRAMDAENIQWVASHIR